MTSHNARRQIREPQHSEASSSSSTHSNFSAVASQQQHQQRASYAPGTGAAFMAQSGWSNRDEYGRPRESATVFPVFTPAPRQTQQQAASQRRFGSNGQQQQSPHQVTFSESPNYKKVYLIALIIVSTLLLLLIAAIVVLLATKVFVYYKACSTSSPSQPTAPLPTSIPLLPPPITNNQQPQLVMRTFECEFFILDQANQLVSTFEGSSLRDMNPTIGVERLENRGADLRIVFRLSIVALEQNTGIRELAIRNLLLSEAGVLEGLLNRTSLDRNRVSVRLIS